MRNPETQFLLGDNREQLATLPAGYFHCCITSPPYFNLRDYGRGGKWEGGDAGCNHHKPKNLSPTSCRPGRSFQGDEQYETTCERCGAMRKEDRQIGREKTPAEFCANLVGVFRGVKRVLRDDGILFVNIGDTYSTNGTRQGDRGNSWGQENVNEHRKAKARPTSDTGCQEKELIGIPWMFAFAMRADGWLIRQEVIWAKAISFGDRHAEQVRERVWAEAKRLGLSDASAAALAACVAPQIGACMPQSCEDRCTTSHEQLFMFTKRPDYFADMEAVKEVGASEGFNTSPKYREMGNGHGGLENFEKSPEKGRNLRTVWCVNPEPYLGDHFAAYPTRLVIPCIKIATSERGCCPVCGAQVERVIEREKLTRERPNKLTKRTGEDGTGNHCANDVDGVATRTKGWRRTCQCPEFDARDKAVPSRCIDPFGGTGTTAVTANGLGRDCTLIELFPEYLEQAKARVSGAVWNPTPGMRRKGPKVAKNQMALFGGTVESEATP